MEGESFGHNLGLIGIERAGENVSVLSSLEEDKETTAGAAAATGGRDLGLRLLATLDGTFLLTLKWLSCPFL